MEHRIDRPGQDFLRGAFNLSVATAAVKVIGALYKIPIQNMLSDAGNGHFKSAYNVYAALLILATAGLPAAVSKMVSEAETSRSGETAAIYGIARAIFMVIGTAGALAMLLGADVIAAALNNPAAAWGIRAIAPAVFFAGMMAPLRGLFQGRGDMVPTAISQVLESAGKFIFGTGLTFFVMNVIMPWDISGGNTEARDIFGAAAAILGVSAGMMLAAFYLVNRKRKLGTGGLSALPGKTPRRRRAIAKELMLLAVPITLGSAMLSVTNLIDDSLVRARLLDGAGFAPEAVDGYMGMYSYASTLYNLPSAFVLTLAVSLLPAIAAYRVKRDKQGVVRTVHSSLRVSMLIGMPAGAGFFCLADPILRLLYPGKPDAVAVAAPLLSTLGIAVVFFSIVTVTNAILQSLGMVTVPIVTMAIGSVFKIVCTLILVGNPAIHIKGAPIGTVICFAVVAALNLGVIIRVSGTGIRLLGELVRPLAAAAGMGFVSYGCYLIFEKLAGARIGCVLAILAGGFSYLVLIILLKALPPEDLKLLPKGDKIAKFLRIS